MNAKVFGAVLTCVVAVATSDARADHPWTKFQPGSWVRYAVVHPSSQKKTATELEKQRSMSETILKTVTKEHIELRQRVQTPHAQDSDTVTKFPLGVHHPPADADAKKEEKPETVTVSGVDFSCDVWRYATVVKDWAEYRTVWIDQKSGRILKVIEGSRTDGFQMKVELTAKDLNVDVPGAGRTFSTIQMVGYMSINNDRMPLVRWVSPEVPGGVVREERKGTHGVNQRVLVGFEAR